jgi:hypothetical protein
MVAGKEGVGVVNRTHKRTITRSNIITPRGLWIDTNRLCKEDTVETIATPINNILRIAAAISQ